jgi:hypothetical protein
LSPLASLREDSRLVLFFYHLLECLQHFVREAHYAAVLALHLKVESLIVVIEKRFGEESFVVEEPLCPLGDGLVFWDSPARADTLTLRGPSFFHSILLEVRGTPVAQR